MQCLPRTVRAHRLRDRVLRDEQQHFVKDTQTDFREFSAVFKNRTETNKQTNKQNTPQRPVSDKEKCTALLKIGSILLRKERKFHFI